MPEGEVLSIGRMDEEDIMLTVKQSLGKLLGTNELNGIIMLPCLGRNMVLGLDFMGEINQVRSILGDSIPWHLAYSGGEVCPVFNSAGKPINRFHNFTFIACAI
jgi:hypothetical protein